jgi:SH3-like domain-containing protein
MKKFTLGLAVAVTAVMAATTIAHAATAYVRRDSDVYRSRTSDRVVNYVERGDYVEVVQCGKYRCEIEIPGRDGWIDIDDLRTYKGRSGGSVTFSFGGIGISIGDY